MRDAAFFLYAVVALALKCETSFMMPVRTFVIGGRVRYIRLATTLHRRLRCSDSTSAGIGWFLPLV